jgi:hypothetical protein
MPVDFFFYFLFFIEIGLVFSLPLNGKKKLDGKSVASLRESHEPEPTGNANTNKWKGSSDNIRYFPLIFAFAPILI